MYFKILTMTFEAWDMVSDTSKWLIVDKLITGSIKISPTALMSIQIEQN